MCDQNKKRNLLPLQMSTETNSKNMYFLNNLGKAVTLNTRQLSLSRDICALNFEHRVKKRKVCRLCVWGMEKAKATSHTEGDFIFVKESTTLFRM